ncbi:nucleotidyltransferase domain-containing protein [Thermococcus barophilus]|uniref:Polymerase nucleotidyl transferase domain-containing protein n=2 Tax=Thermococcus barophilus TaxID=55802 RepID=A0A0S1X8U9_THEBA|nr:nucleotidyltransferase domain-containing protein [Thermococcus barophilus]ADT83148.1 hypothetical protein TERMP_00171 [Thermococcus barophilus MP]ALM74188.1 hypothetical protein TBCH5v1_0210 [Thermococcus barophilus]
MKDYKKIAEEFGREVSKLLGDQLVKVILFGSVARGKERENSDIDVLIIVRDNSWKIQQDVSGIVLKYLIKYGVYISVKVVTEEEFEIMRDMHSSFYHEVFREGIRIA